MSKIDERLEAMGINTSEMSDEEKFQTATGLTFYDEELAANDWYVPGGAANVKSEDNNDGGEDDQDDDSDPSNVEIETAATWEYIHDEASWNASYQNGLLKKYYTHYDAASPYKEDLWNTVENRAANWNDIEKDENQQPIEYEDGYHYANCVRCWEGAINAPGAKYPWAAVSLPVPFEGYVKFIYNNGEPVYPWGNSVRTFESGFGIASIPTELGEQFLLDEQGNTTFDSSKLQVVLVS